jgi:hypothetical protein
MAGRIYGTLRRAEAMGNRGEDYLLSGRFREADGKVLVNVVVWRTMPRRSWEKNGRPFWNREAPKSLQLLIDTGIRFD